MNSRQPVSEALMSHPYQASTTEQMGNHETYLFQIGTGLGLCGDQCTLFVQQVLAQASLQVAYRKVGLPLRIWLAQMMVHKCLFHISSELFRQMGRSGREVALYSPNMPLSFWAVYRLRHTIGLTEAETSLVLKTSVGQVKERWSRALACIHKHRNSG